MYTITEEIEAPRISPDTYSYLDCAQLRDESERIGKAHSDNGSAHNESRSNYSTIVIMSGLQVASLPGTKMNEEIAERKGRQELLAQTYSRQNC